MQKRNNYTVIREPYIDRALTGTNDKRPQFQKMIADSAKQLFEVVLVYTIDRFGRNLRESIENENKLQLNGAILESATENFQNTPAGRFQRNLMMSYAQFYSDELSEKVTRGIALSVEQCKFIGGFVPLGYTVDESKHYQIDPLTVPVVQKCFELYAAGNTLKNINAEITEQFGKSYFGNASNSLNRIFDNKNYIGIYTRGGSEVIGGMPRIGSDELFERVRIMRQKDKKTPAKSRAYEEYLLTTKLFCGYDREMMVGVSGTSKTGTVHHYYTCKNVWRKKGCKKKNVKKAYIENFILEKAREQLTDENIALIADAVSEISKTENNTPIIAEIKRKLKDNAAAIENLLKAIEGGEHIDLLSERITQKKQEKTDLEKSLAREQVKKTEVDETEIKFFLTRLKNGDIEDIKYKRALIAIFINAIYLYDNHATIFFNAVDKPIEVDYNILDAIEKTDKINGGECSYMKPTAPPFPLFKS